MMNGMDRPDSGNLESNVGASAHAHQLAKMRVSQKIQSPTTPITPIAPTSPTFIPEVRFGEENVMEGMFRASRLNFRLSRSQRLSGARDDVPPRHRKAVSHFDVNFSPRQLRNPRLNLFTRAVRPDCYQGRTGSLVPLVNYHGDCL
ncbi:uncharacterized protein LOC119599522 isoform X1 [Penaeus monodon]|uniref:uncharacterized protein LOC119599522 isoform X1 n=1 Tax=Penaeus monodon TaxID=6687 RepID=UPI0018A706C3|nr:uncharacterized protein LOC119599522 isoform X1 [Penaeus monodon]